MMLMLSLPITTFGTDRSHSTPKDIYTELWGLDENRLTPGKHYRINLQGGQSGAQPLIVGCGPFAELHFFKVHINSSR